MLDYNITDLESNKTVDRWVDMLARLEKSRRNGRGVRLTYDELHLLSISSIGEAMSAAYDEKYKAKTEIRDED